MNQGRELLEAIDERGEIGFIDLTMKPQNAASENLRVVRLGDDETALVPVERLTAITPNTFRFAGSFRDVAREDGARPTAAQFNEPQNLSTGATLEKGGEIVVPLIAEEIVVGKRTVDTGGVRVHKTVREDVRTIDEPTIREHLDVERVHVNRFVETAPGIRYEGDMMIVPVLEEVVVTQKRLLLREEIRLTKRREEISNPQEVVLKREEISLEPIAANNNIESGKPEDNAETRTK